MVSSPTMLTEDGTVKSADSIRELFVTKGVDPSKPMAFSCGAGVMASFGLACARKAGLEGQCYLYDGSWTEWSAM